MYSLSSAYVVRMGSIENRLNYQDSFNWEMQKIECIDIETRNVKQKKRID